MTFGAAPLSEPLVGPITIVNVSVSFSVSAAVSTIDRSVSSRVVRVWSRATGGVLALMSSLVIVQVFTSPSPIVPTQSPLIVAAYPAGPDSLTAYAPALSVTRVPAGLPAKVAGDGAL